MSEILRPEDLSIDQQDGQRVEESMEDVIEISSDTVEPEDAYLAGK